MLELESVRERLRLLQRIASEQDIDFGEGITLESISADMTALVGEIDAFRRMCEHRHTLQVFDVDGNPTRAFACVNCHEVFQRDEHHLPIEEDFTEVEPE